MSSHQAEAVCATALAARADSTAPGRRVLATRANLVAGRQARLASLAATVLDDNGNPVPGRRELLVLVPVGAAVVEPPGLAPTGGREPSTRAPADSAARSGRAVPEVRRRPAGRRRSRTPR
jgi:hypothetical protein